MPGYSGTGMTTGPIPINISGIGTATATVTDPHSPGSAQVQIQNNTILPMNAIIGGETWNLTGSQSSTFDLPPDGAGVTYVITNPAPNNVNGTIAFVWLLDGQSPPQPDGSLTKPNG